MSEKPVRDVLLDKSVNKQSPNPNIYFALFHNSPRLCCPVAMADDEDNRYVQR